VQSRKFAAVGIEEKAAVLLEPDGRATVVGHGDAYLVDSKDMVAGLEKDSSLTLTGASVSESRRAHVQHQELARRWSQLQPFSQGSKIQSTQPGGGVY